MQVATPLGQHHGTLLEQLFANHRKAAYGVATREKAVAAQLFRRSAESFLPLYHTVHYSKKRRAEAELPVFPSYLLVSIRAAEHLRVKEVLAQLKRSGLVSSAILTTFLPWRVPYRCRMYDQRPLRQVE